MRFFISVMFLGFPDKIHKEKPSFLDFENNWLRTDRRTDRRTDWRMDGRTDGRIDRPSCRDARTHLKTRRDVDRSVRTKSMTSLLEWVNEKNHFLPLRFYYYLGNFFLLLWSCSYTFFIRTTFFGSAWIVLKFLAVFRLKTRFLDL